MNLFIAVTSDEYELPLFVTDSVHAMADWAGIKADSVYSLVSRNAKKPPMSPRNAKREFRIRKIHLEDDENDQT